MKKSLNLWQLAGFIFTGVAGVLLHFLFEWTGKSIFVAPFAAVNESIWEHMKLLFVPMFLLKINILKCMMNFGALSWQGC